MNLGTVGRIPKNLMLLAWVLATSTAVGQVPLRFREFGPKDGLSQVQINDIVQDAVGFLWLATKDGLNRYDGYEFTVYRNRPDDPYSLSDSLIQALAVDGAQRLWVGTHAGLNQYDHLSERFFRIPLDTADPGREIVVCLLPLHDGLLAVGTENRGLFLYNPADGRTTQWSPASLPGPRPSVETLVETPDGTLWIGTREGLVRLAPDRSGLLPLPGDTAAPLLDQHNITALLTRADGQLWVGTHTALYLLDPKDGTCRAYDMGRARDTAAFDPVWDLFASGDMLWVGRESGLYRIDPFRPPEAREADDLYQGFRDGHNVYDLYEDRNGLLWIGTGGHGLYMYNPRRPFLFMGNQTQAKANLKRPYIYAVQTTRDGNLWVGNVDGVNVWDPREGTMYHLGIPSVNSANLSTVWTLRETGDGTVWAGTSAGLWRFDPNTWRDGPTRITPESHAPEHAAPREALPENVTTILEDPATDHGPMHLWLGSASGLYRYTPETGDVLRLTADDTPEGLAHAFVRCLAWGTYHGEPTLFAGTEGGGLEAVRLHDRHVTHLLGAPDTPHTLSHNMIISLYMQSDTGLLWAGTRGGGLYALDTERDHVTRYRTADGLANDTVYGILDDGRGALWLSTNQGLSRLNQADGTFVGFHATDGLQGDEFNTGAAFRGPDGRLYFGGTQGLTYFNPADITMHETPPELAFTRFLLFNQPVPTTHRMPDSPLTRPISETRAVTLDHTRNVFSISFTAFDFSNPEANRYAYRMEGFDTDWLTADSRGRTAGYTNLDPGTYTFRVKAANNDGFWNETGIALRVTLLPAPWRTPLAYALYGVCAVLLVGGYVVRERRGKRILRRLVAERTADLQRKNEDLDAGLRELETLFQMAQTINRESDLNRIVNTVLDQGLTLFPQADMACYLAHDPSEKVYRYVAVTGMAERDYKGKSVHQNTTAAYEQELEKAGTRVFYVPETPAHIRDKLITRAISLIMLPIQLNGRLVGILALINRERAGAFDDVDMARLERFSEHLVTAVMRIEVVNDLVDTQRALVAEAHRGGMAETAAQVLHNMGNSLNGTLTCAQLVQETARRTLWHDRLGKVITHYGETLAVAAEDAAEDHRRRLLYEMLLKIHGNLMGQSRVLQAQCDELQEGLGQILNVLHEQHLHTRVRPQLEPTNLNEIVRETLAMEIYTFRQEGVQVETRLAQLPLLTLEPSKLRLAFLCLLEHARAAMAANRSARTAHLIITSELADNQVLLHVQDNGQGIAAPDLDKVCRQGYGTKRQGGGHGLHYAANAVRALDGRLTITSLGPDLGTTVTLTFPCTPEHVAVAAATPIRPAPYPTTPTSNPGSPKS